jgi:type II secretory pathway predicted ATPase ExeA
MPASASSARVSARASAPKSMQWLLARFSTDTPAAAKCSGHVYPKYFGLKEASFSITPDPQYLFLSEQHREALAHLLYGAGDSGGFVLLTGEVGTGKTTVCRAFLEQLPPDVDVALVLNPAMTAVELLHAICDEFGVEVPVAEQSAKALVDRLNRFCSMRMPVGAARC